MPNYDELIQQSHENVRALNEKLNELDALHQEIKSLIQLPEETNKKFDIKFQEIVQFTEKYTKTLGVSTQTYIDGNNHIFISKLKDFDAILVELKKEINRLVGTDFITLFKELQKEFITKTRTDVQEILNVFEEKNIELQVKISELEEQITRLSAIDLEEHFKRHQNKLSEIFNAVNSINIALSGITHIINSITLSLGDIQRKIEKSHQTTTNLIDVVNNNISNHLHQQDQKTKYEFEKIRNQLSKLEKQNTILRKDIKTNRIIHICEIAAVLIGMGLIALYFFIK